MQRMQDIELEILQRFDESRNAYNRASALLRAGREQEAETLLRQALALYPREALMDPEGEMDRTIRESFERLFVSIRLRLEEIEKKRAPLHLGGGGVTNLQDIIERNLKLRERETGARPESRRPGRREPLAADWATAGVAPPPEPAPTDEQEAVPQENIIRELLRGAMDSLETRTETPAPEPAISETAPDETPVPEQPAPVPRPPQPAFFEEPFLEDLAEQTAVRPEPEYAQIIAEPVEETPSAAEPADIESIDTTPPVYEEDEAPLVSVEESGTESVIEEAGIDEQEIELLMDDAATAPPLDIPPPEAPSIEDVDEQLLAEIDIEEEFEAEIGIEPPTGPEPEQVSEPGEPAVIRTGAEEGLRERLRNLLSDEGDQAGEGGPEPLQAGDTLEELIIPEEQGDLILAPGEPVADKDDVYVGDETPARDAFDDLTPLRRPDEPVIAETRQEPVSGATPAPDEFTPAQTPAPEISDREQPLQQIQEPAADAAAVEPPPASPPGPAPALDTGKGGGMGFFGKLKQKLTGGKKRPEAEQPAEAAEEPAQDAAEFPAEATAEAPAPADAAVPAEEIAPIQAPQPAPAPAPPAEHADDEEGLEDEAVVAAMVKIEVKQPRTIGHMRVYDSSRTVRLLVNVVILALIGAGLAAAYIIIKPAVQLERAFAYAIAADIPETGAGLKARAADFIWETQTTEPKISVESHRDAITAFSVIAGDSNQSKALVASVTMTGSSALATAEKYHASIKLAALASGSGGSGADINIQYCDTLFKGIKQAVKNKEYNAALQRVRMQLKLLEKPEFPTPGIHGPALREARILAFVIHQNSIISNVKNKRPRDAFFEIVELSPIDDPELKDQTQLIIQQLKTDVRDALLAQARVARDEKKDNDTAEDLINKAKQLEAPPAQ